MTTNETFFDWVEHERNSRGWSLRELARKIDKSTPTVADMLSFKKTPSLEMCKALAQVFGKDEVWVLVKAGLISKPTEWEPEDEEMRRVFKELTTVERRALIAAGRAMRDNRGE
jgi:transcriptional regulator with XRE-family HTH domain